MLCFFRGRKLKTLFLGKERKIRVRPHCFAASVSFSCQYGFVFFPA
jgi:hypothetical protein